MWASGGVTVISSLMENIAQDLYSALKELQKEQGAFFFLLLWIYYREKLINSVREKRH